LSKIKENKGLRGDVLAYVAQARPLFDTEIGQKNHFRMETNYVSCDINMKGALAYA
jgi:hypothetical protein